MENEELKLPSEQPAYCFNCGSELAKIRRRIGRDRLGNPEYVCLNVGGCFAAKDISKADTWIIEE